MRMPTDEDIKKNVVEELYFDARIDASNITVEVDNGKVFLGGSVPTYYNASSAADDALGVYGAKSVVNQIEVRYPGTAPFQDDEDMQFRLQNRMSADPDIDSLDIRVSVVDGVVTLEGSVNALWKKYHAEHLAAREPSVVAIRNDLSVVPTDDHVDRDIAADIIASLKRKVVNEQDIDVRVEKGVVNLTGFVPNPVIRKVVNQTAMYTPGVVQVVDNLTLSQNKE